MASDRPQNLRCSFSYLFSDWLSDDGGRVWRQRDWEVRNLKHWSCRGSIFRRDLRTKRFVYVRDFLHHRAAKGPSALVISANHKLRYEIVIRMNCNKDPSSSCLLHYSNFVWSPVCRLTCELLCLSATALTQRNFPWCRRPNRVLEVGVRHSNTVWRWDLWSNLCLSIRHKECQVNLRPWRRTSEKGRREGTTATSGGVEVILHLQGNQV